MASPHALDLRRAPGAVPVPPPVRLGLLDRYLLRVVVSRFLLCLGLIFAIMMLERTLRLATQMAAAGAHLSFLGSMILNLAPHYLGLALPPALLLAVLLGVMRLDGDLEVEAMLAGGFPLRRIIAVFAGLGLAVALAGLLVIGFLEPMGRYGFRLRRSGELEPQTGAAICEFHRYSHGALKIRMHDKLPALMLLGRHLGLFGPGAKTAAQIRAEKLVAEDEARQRQLTALPLEKRRALMQAIEGVLGK